MDVLPGDGMQEARGSSPLSSTAQDLASGQVRSSLDRPHLSRRVGSFSVLGGIWEINYAWLGWRASCHGERHRCRIPSQGGNPVLVEVSAVLSRHHCASAVAYPRTVFGDHKCPGASSHSSTGLTVR